jgi:hypothetical protein
METRSAETEAGVRQKEETMKKRVTGALLAITLAIVMSAPLGCAEALPGQTPSPTVSTSTPTTNRWLDVLRAIPASEDTTLVAYVQDHARLAEKQRQYVAVAAVQDRMMVMQNSGMWNALRRYPDEWQKNMGFVAADIELEAFVSPPASLNTYQVIRGRFDREVIESALKSDPMNDDFQTISYGGLDYFSAGEDGMNPPERSNLRPLGQGMRLTVVDDLVFTTTFTRTMQEMIDTYQGRQQSLAELESYQLLSDGLDTLGAFAAVLSSAPQGQSAVKAEFQEIIDDPGEAGSPRRIFVEQLQREILLEPYRAFATGMGLDENGYYMAIVLLNADEQAAEKNLAALPEQIKTSVRTDGAPWVDASEPGVKVIMKKGRLTLAKLYGKSAFWWKAFDMGTGAYEPLLIHKG